MSDPFFDKVRVLLNGEGTAGATPTNYGSVVAAANGLTNTSAWSQFGTKSVSPDAFAAWDLASETAVTVEFFIRTPATLEDTGSSGFLDIASTVNDYTFGTYNSGGGVIKFRFGYETPSGTAYVNYAPTLTANTTYFFAYQQTADGKTSFYGPDGSLLSTVTIDPTLVAGFTAFIINGGYSAGPFLLLDDLRVSAKARYVDGSNIPLSSITVPTSAFDTGPTYGVYAVMPMPTVAASAHAVITIVSAMPMPTVSSTGRTTDYGVTAVMPTFRVETHGGGNARATMPKPTVASTGTVRAILSAAITMPMPRVTASARASYSSTVAATMPGFSASAHGGGYVRAAMPTFTATGAMRAGSSGRVAAVMPRFIVSAGATARNHGGITATMPMLRKLQPARVAAVMPMARVTMVGYATVTVSYEAYVMNVMPAQNVRDPLPNQVTRYPDYGFTQIVRLGADYYGVAPDGLYKLGGTTDNGAPIPWAWESHVSDFDSMNHKNVPTAFLGGVAGPEVTFKVRTGEAVDQLHTNTTVSSTTSRNHRQKFGRGRKSRYYGFGMESADGALELESLGLEIDEMTRRI